MEENTVQTRLISYIADICDLDPAQLSSETRVDDIGFDSLALPRILAAMETEFLIRLQDEDIEGLLGARRVGDYLDVLNAALRRSG